MKNHLITIGAIGVLIGFGYIAVHHVEVFDLIIKIVGMLLLYVFIYAVVSTFRGSSVPSDSLSLEKAVKKYKKSLREK